MKCCTLPDSEGGHKHKGGRHKRTTKLGVAANLCSGKSRSAFKKCVKAKIKKMR